MTDSNAFPSGGGALSALARYLFGDSSQPQQPQPAQPQRALLGTTQPQVPSWDQANSDRSSFTGLLSGMLGHGIGPGIANALMPDSMYAPQYNAELGGAQGVEMQRLGLPKAQLVSDVFRGDVDPSTGQRIAPGESQFGAPQVPSPLQQSQDLTTQTGASPGLLMEQPGDFGPGLSVGTAPTLGRPSGVSWAASPQGQQAIRAAATAQPGDFGAMPGAAPGVMPGAQPASGPKLFGVPTPGGMNPQAAFLASQLAPDLFKEFASGYFAPARANSYHIGANGQLQYMPGGDTGIPVPPSDPNYQALMAQQLRTQKGIEGQARVTADNAIADHKYELDTGQTAPGGGGAAPPQSPPSVNIPGAQNGPAPSAGTGTGSNSQKVVTDRGTVVPLPKGNQVIGPGADLIGKQNTESVKTEGNWNAIRPTIETSRQRLGALADSYSQLQTKGLTEGRADIANDLRGLGMDGIADKVMSAGDTVNVQKALWNGMQDVLASLKTINAGTGGRILNSEFNAFLEHGFSPNMMGPALRGAITQQLGTTYQIGNMIDDYYGTGRQAGWRDSNQFQSSYLRANPIEGFVKYADNTVPQFKGTTTAPTITPENQVKATQLRNNYRMLPAAEQAKQRDNFMGQLRTLGYE